MVGREPLAEQGAGVQAVPAGGAETTIVAVRPAVAMVETAVAVAQMGGAPIVRIRPARAARVAVAAGEAVGTSGSNRTVRR